MTKYTLFVRLTLIATWMFYTERLVQGDNIPGWRPTSEKGTSLNFHSDIQERERRAQGTISPNCNSWSPWLNDNHPSGTNKNDYERVTSAQIASYCPVHLGATATKVQCKDDKGEPFSGPIKDPTNNFAGNCTDVATGVTCEMFNQNSINRCPDFSLSFYCNCTEASTIAQQGQSLQSSSANLTSMLATSSSTGSMSPTSATYTPYSAPTTLAVSTMKSTGISSTNPPSILTTSPSTGSMSPTSATYTPYSAPTTLAVSTITSTGISSTNPPNLVTTPSSMGSKSQTSATNTTSSSPTTLAESTMTSTGISNTDKQIYCKDQSKHEMFENDLLLFILCVVCILLCVFNFVLVLVLHRRAMAHTKTKWQSQVKPLRLV